MRFFILKILLKKNSNIILYCIVFGVALSTVMGPFGTVAGIAIGLGVGIALNEDKKNNKK